VEKLALTDVMCYKFSTLLTRCTVCRASCGRYARCCKWLCQISMGSTWKILTTPALENLWRLLFMARWSSWCQASASQCQSITCNTT